MHPVLRPPVVICHDVLGLNYWTECLNPRQMETRWRARRRIVLSKPENSKSGQPVGPVRRCEASRVGGRGLAWWRILQRHTLQPDADKHRSGPDC